jgi:hypothetical protein
MLVSRPEIFCWILLGRRSRSAWLAVGGTVRSWTKRGTSSTRSRGPPAAAGLCVPSSSAVRTYPDHQRVRAGSRSSPSSATSGARAWPACPTGPRWPPSAPRSARPGAAPRRSARRATSPPAQAPENHTSHQRITRRSTRPDHRPLHHQQASQPGATTGGEWSHPPSARSKTWARVSGGV